MNVKKTYQRPTVTKVELRPEEAVLTACKTSDSATNRRCSAFLGTCTNTQGS